MVQYMINTQLKNIKNRLPLPLQACIGLKKNESIAKFQRLIQGINFKITITYTLEILGQEVFLKFLTVFWQQVILP